MIPLAVGSDQPPIDRHDAVLFDLDGVLYVGPHAVPGVPEVVAEVRARGVAVAYVTNNAARTPQTVAAHLSDLGIPATAGDVVTSAQAVAAMVAAELPPGSAVLVVGGEGLRVALEQRGLTPVDTAERGPAAVVQGFSPDVGWRLLAEGTYAVHAGAAWYASNLDSTVPTDRGIAPGNGALVEVIASATGARPVVAGKPETPLHVETVRRVGSRDPLVVGDRLDTDIEGANRVGAASLLVLTGVSTARDLVLAAETARPTYVAADLRAGLLSAHPPVTPTESGGQRCGGWTCTPTGSSVDLHGDGDRVDALRALCVAVWSLGRRPGPGEVERALVTGGW